MSESRQKSQEIDATRYGDEYRVPLESWEQLRSVVGVDYERGMSRPLADGT